MDSAEMKEARELLNEADKMATPTKWIFGLSQAPKYDEASDLYNRAGNVLKASKNWKDAGEAFLKAAEMDTLGGNKEESARKFLSASSCFKKVEPSLAVSALQKAIGVFVKSGRFHAAATHEKEIAEIYESQLNDPGMAMEYYEKAADRYMAEDSVAIAQGCSIKAAMLAAQAEKFDKAVEIFEDAANKSINDALRKYSVRDYLFRAGLCRLCQDDAVGARRAIERYPDLDSAFASSREYKLLQGVIHAIDEEDVDAFTREVGDFDKVSTLDDWKTALLVRIKRSMDEPTDGLS